MMRWFKRKELAPMPQWFTVDWDKIQTVDDVKKFLQAVYGEQPTQTWFPPALQPYAKRVQ